MTPLSASVELRLGEATLEELCDWIAGGVYDRLRLKKESPWLDVKEAAEYLGWSPQRIYKSLDLPRHKHGNRLMFRRDELDDYLGGL